METWKRKQKKRINDSRTHFWLQVSQSFLERQFVKFQSVRKKFAGTFLARSYEEHWWKIGKLYPRYKGGGGRTARCALHDRRPWKLGRRGLVAVAKSRPREFACHFKKRDAKILGRAANVEETIPHGLPVALPTASTNRNDGSLPRFALPLHCP